MSITKKLAAIGYHPAPSTEQEIAFGLDYPQPLDQLAFKIGLYLAAKRLLADGLGESKLRMMDPRTAESLAGE